MIRPSRSTVAAATVLACLAHPAAAFGAGEREAARGEETPLTLPADDGEVAAGAASSGSVARTIIGLAVVLAVIYGLYWVLQQIKASREESTRGEGLQTVASLGLGPNRALHLVRAGSDLLLLGVGEHGVTPVRAYTEAEAIAAGLIAAPGMADEVIDGDVVVAERRALTRPGRLPARGSLSWPTVIGVLRAKTVRS